LELLEEHLLGGAVLQPVVQLQFWRFSVVIELNRKKLVANAQPAKGTREFASPQKR
jgi:hypothetical protein